MADLIDRTALGIGEANREVFENPAYADGWNSAIKIIKAASTVDAVPVVRCKDCIWFGGKHGCPLAESGYFLHGKMLPLDNDYCSYGERRVENGGTTSD